MSAAFPTPRALWSRFQIRAETIDREGEYKSLAPYPSPLTIWFGTHAPRRLFYFTKESFIAFLGRQSLIPGNWLALVRAFLPTRESLLATQHLVRGFERPMIFVGDLRPMDLTVFALLRMGEH